MNFEQRRIELKRRLQEHGYGRGAAPIASAPVAVQAEIEDPSLEALGERIMALALAVLDFQVAYKNAIVGRWWAELNKPENRARKDWSDKWRKYEALLEEAREACPQWAEYQVLCQEYDALRLVGPGHCYECEVQKGMVWTHENVQRFIREHGKQARLCAFHSLELTASRSKQRRQKSA